MRQSRAAKSVALQDKKEAYLSDSGRKYEVHFAEEVGRLRRRIVARTRIARLPRPRNSGKACSRLAVVSKLVSQGELVLPFATRVPPGKACHGRGFSPTSIKAI